MSFAAICVTVACLLIVGSFSCLVYNINIMVEDLNKTNEVLVFIDEGLSEAEAKSVTTDLNDLDNIQKVEWVYREEAWDDFVSDYDENQFAGLGADILRYRVRVILMDYKLIDATVAEIEQVAGVAEVKAAYTEAKVFTTVQDVLQVASLVVIAVLLLVSLLIISNTVKLAMYDRRDEIAIMKMVGATNGFIRLPFVVEGFTLGMIGAGAAFGLLWLLYDWVLMKLNSIDTLKLLLDFVPFQGGLMLSMIVVFAAAGFFVGVVGSWTSIRKFLDV